MDDERSSAVRLTLVFCFLAALCEGFDVQTAGVAAAGLRDELRPTPAELGWFFSASGAGLLVGAIIGGRLADHIGRRTVVTTSLAIFGVCSLLTSFAGTMPTLTAARALTGLGLGGAMPNLIAIAADTSVAKARNTAIAIIYLGMPLGGATASAIILAIPTDAWRTVFRVGGIAPLVIAAGMTMWMPASRSLPSAPLSGHAEPTTMLHALFGRGRRSTTLVVWVGFFLVNLTLHLMLNWLPLLMLGRGLGSDQAAVSQIAFSIGGATTSLVLGWLLDSRWQRASILGTIVSLPIVLLLLATSPPRGELLVCLVLLLGGAILGQQVIAFGAASSFYPARVRGAGMGSAVAAGRLGSLAGPLFAATLLSAGRTPSDVLIGLLPIGVVCGASIGILGWRNLRA